MLRRAIICAFLALAGTSMATATPLNPEQKIMAFQPGNGVSLTQPSVLPSGTAPRGDLTSARAFVHPAGGGRCA